MPVSFAARMSSLLAHFVLAVGTQESVEEIRVGRLAKGVPHLCFRPFSLAFTRSNPNVRCSERDGWGVRRKIISESGRVTPY